MEPHRLRQAAESFGVDAARYDRTRPRYPEEMIARIVGTLPARGPEGNAQSGADVLDVGCGTGIASRQFARAGCRVLGVDVDERMAAFARERGTQVEVAPFETWDAAGRTFDAVVAGQTWHWIDPVAGAAAAVRVLRPGGRLALFWNAFQLPPELQDAFGAVHARVVPEFPLPAMTTDSKAPNGKPADSKAPNGKPANGEAPNPYGSMAGTAIAGLRATAGLEEPEVWEFEHQREYTRDEWLDMVPTQGLYTRLPPDRLQQLLDGLATAIDAVGGRVTMRHPAVVVTAIRTAGPREPG